MRQGSGRHGMFPCHLSPFGCHTRKFDEIRRSRASIEHAVRVVEVGMAAEEEGRNEALNLDNLPSRAERRKGGKGRDPLSIDATKGE